jgi:hypothetical protein
METSRTGASVGAWSSLLSIEGGRPLRVDGYDPFGTHYAHGEQVSARIFAALSVRPQRVTAPTVHAEHQPATPATSTTVSMRAWSLRIFELLPEDERSWAVTLDFTRVRPGPYHGARCQSIGRAANLAPRAAK